MNFNSKSADIRAKKLTLESKRVEKQESKRVEKPERLPLRSREQNL